MTILVGPLASMIVLVATAWSLGGRLTKRLHVDDEVASFGITTSLGLGLLASLLFFLGLLKGLTPPNILLLVVAIHATGWRSWRRALSAGWRSRVSGLRPPTLFLVALAPASLLPFFPATVFDSTVYHLPFVRAFLEARGPVFVPELRFPIFPILNEMLFTAMSPFAGDVGAHLVHFVEGILVAVLLAAWGRRRFGERVGLWAAAMWLGTPLVVWIAGAAYVDLGLALFVTSSLFALSVWKETRDQGWVVLAGALAGFAAATKYLGLFFVAVVGLVVLIDAIRRPPTKSTEGGAVPRWTPVLAVVLAASAALLPWYVWIVVETGNPVFPFYPKLFGVTDWTPELERRAFLSASTQPEAQPSVQVGTLAGRTLEAVLALVRVPWDTLFFRQRFHFQAPLSPWLLPLVPAAFLMALRERRIRWHLVLVTVYGLFWLTTIRDIRFLLAAYPVLCLCMAAALDRMIRRPKERGRGSLLVAGLTVLLLAPGSLYAVYKLEERGFPPLSPAARDAFLVREVRAYEALHWLEQRHGEAYSVYTLHGGYLRHHSAGRFLGDGQGPHRYEIVLPLLEDPEALFAKLRTWDVDYLLAVRRNGPKAKRSNHLWDDDPTEAFASRFDLALKTEDFVLFRLRAPAEAPPS